MSHNWPEDDGPDNDHPIPLGSTLIVVGVVLIIFWVAIAFFLLKLIGVL